LASDYRGRPIKINDRRVNRLIAQQNCGGSNWSAVVSDSGKEVQLKVYAKEYELRCHELILRGQSILENSRFAEKGFLKAVA
jgi:hypothetical protein